MKRDGNYRVSVSWTEITREGGSDVHLQYGQLYYPGIDDLDAGKLLYSRALQNGGWAAPETAHNVQIELRGEGVGQLPPSTPEQVAGHPREIRRILAGCSGPLTKGLAQGTNRGHDRGYDLLPPSRL